MLTGLLLARALAPAGRGELAAVLIAPNVATWLFGMGAAQALSVHLVRADRAAGALVSAWLIMLVPLGLLAIVAIEALLPVLLAAQTQRTLELAQIVAPGVLLSMYTELLFGLLLGTHQFRLYNRARVAVPLLTLAAYCVLLAFGALTVVTAVATTVVASCISIAIMTAGSRGTWRVEAPDWTAAWRSAAFGFKANVANLTATANVRLDVLIIPAYLGAHSVGLYAIATTVSWTLYSAASAVAPILLPFAARRGSDPLKTVVPSFQVVLALAALMACAIALVAPAALAIVYGEEFREAAGALRILLPGCVVLAAAGVLWSGLLSLDRPLAAAASQLPGLAVMIVGLLTFVRSGGIEAAAAVASTAYAVMFVATCAIYSRAAGISTRMLYTVSAGRRATA